TSLSIARGIDSGLRKKRKSKCSGAAFAISWRTPRLKALNRQGRKEFAKIAKIDQENEDCLRALCDILAHFAVKALNRQGREEFAKIAKKGTMATQTTTLPVHAAPLTGVSLPAFTLWWREVVR